MTKELTHREVVEYVKTQSQDRAVALEGPPIYLWPNLPTQNWDHPAVRTGWELTEQIRSGLEHRSGSDAVRHWVLVDEFNYRPESPGNIDPVVGVRGISRVVPQLARLPIFTSIPEDFKQGRGFCESDFLSEVSSPVCSQLDASFQIRKLTESLLEGRSSSDYGQMRTPQILESLEPLPLLLMVHPEDFWAQQEAMLGTMLGKMRKSPYLERLYGKIPAPSRRRIIEGTYMHIWIDEIGLVGSVTRPQWNEQRSKFDHMPQKV